GSVPQPVVERRGVVVGKQCGHVIDALAKQGHGHVVDVLAEHVADNVAHEVADEAADVATVQGADGTADGLGQGVDRVADEGHGDLRFAGSAGAGCDQGPATSLPEVSAPAAQAPSGAPPAGVCPWCVDNDPAPGSRGSGVVARLHHQGSQAPGCKALTQLAGGLPDRL